MNRGAWRVTVHGVTESGTTEGLTLSFCVFQWHLFSVTYPLSVQVPNDLFSEQIAVTLKEAGLDNP